MFDENSESGMIRINRQHYRNFYHSAFLIIFSAFISSSSAFSVLDCWSTGGSRNGVDKTTRMGLHFASNIPLSMYRSTSIRSSSSCSRSHNQNIDQDITGGNSIQFENLMEMDVVTFARKKKLDRTEGNEGDRGIQLNDDTSAILELGTIHGGFLVPLCAWTTESIFASTGSTDTTIIEFLQDDRAELPQKDEVTLHSLLPTEAISYGSRQIGGGKGPKNPHGEESELLYYVEKQMLEDLGVHIVVRPELEIFW